MSSVTTADGIEIPTKKSANSLWKDARNRILKNRVALAAFVVIVFYVLMALLAGTGVIATDYNLTNTDNKWLAPSAEYLFGTDIFGRSVLQRAIHGSVIAVTVGFFAALIALFIGVTMGALAGYFGGWIDDSITWLYTTLDSIPYILLMASFQFALGQGLSNLFIALGLTSWVTLCRLVRAEFLKQKQKEYVESARSLGASHARRIFLHIIPNVMHLGLIQFGLIFVSAIKIEVILSFLGLGVEAGVPSWGIMINEAKQELQRGYWWNLGAATVFMFGLVLAVNLFNDALRDALDPKLKNK